MSYAHKAAIAKNIQVIEELKAELVGNAAGVLKAMAKDDLNTALDSMAANLISTYLLAKKLGVGFDRLDRQVIGKLEQTISATLGNQGLEAALKQLLDYLQDSWE